MQSAEAIRHGITHQIIESLKKGMIPWRKPWTGIEGPRIPTNFVTGNAYSGINIPILWATSQDRKYDVDYYATFNQWKSVGASVKKGEKAINLVLFKPINKIVKKEDGLEDLKTFPLMKTFPVFSIHSVTGEVVDKVLNQPTFQISEHEQRTEFFQFISATDAQIEYGSLAAAYFPKTDHIQMPHEAQFHGFAAFAETVSHELAHWTEKRLGWNGSYAEGELRAELAAVYTTAALNIPDTSRNLENHAAYIQSWLTALENDTKFIFRAATAASKATDFLLSFSNSQVEVADALVS
jgi:antirestriction protein ArdC